MKTSRIAYSLMSTILLVTTLAGAARAETDAQCRTYAARSVGDDFTNINNHCGFPNGPRWQSVTANHYNWCRSVATGLPENEQSIRTAYLLLCKHDPVATSCQTYAREATAQIAKAKAIKCLTDSSPRWTADTDSHFSWCVATNNAVSANETAGRNVTISFCQGKTISRPGRGTPSGGSGQPFCAATCDECAAAGKQCRSAITGACPPSFEQVQRNFQCF